MVRNILIQNDGKILLEGSIKSYNGFPMAAIGRILPNGTPDTLYQLPRETRIKDFNMLAVQPDNKLLITARMQVGRDKVALDVGRFNQNGSFHSTFTPRILRYGYYYDMLSATAALQKDGKILMAVKYHFPHVRNQLPGPGYAGTSILIKILRNSLSDTSFTPNIFEEGWIESLNIQSDNKILATGWIYESEGKKTNSIVRFNPDGSPDQSFKSITVTDGKISTTMLHPDGKFSISGDFSASQKLPRNKIARHLKNGNLDKSFDPGPGPDGEITSHVVQADGKIIIVGKFSSYNGIPRKGIARLNINGSFDTSFDPGSGLEGFANNLVLLPDGKVLIGGNFRSYNGIPRNGLIRIHTH